MEYTVRNTRVLLLVGLLIYAASMFPMWWGMGWGGGAMVLWSYQMWASSGSGRAWILGLFDYWFTSSIGLTFFVSITMTVLFGFTALLWGIKKRFGWILLVLVLIFACMPVGSFMFGFSFFDSEFWHLAKFPPRIYDFRGVHSGFWIACFAIVLLALSLHERFFREKPVPDASTIIWDNPVETFNDASKTLTSANILRIGQILTFSAGLWNLIYMALFNQSVDFLTISWIIPCLIILSAFPIRPRRRIFQLSSGVAILLLSFCWWLSIIYRGQGLVSLPVIDDLTQPIAGMSLIGLTLAFLGGSIRIFYHQEE